MAAYVPKEEDLVEITGPVLAIRPKTGTVKEVWHNMRRALVRVHGGTVELLFFTRLSPAKIKEKRVMSEEKLTHAELGEIFGKTMPIEAVNLIWNSPDHVTVGEIRRELRAMGNAHKRQKAVADAIAKRLEPYATDAENDWDWIFHDTARVALEAADAILAPGGVPFDDAARTALAEIGNIAFNMKQSSDSFPLPPQMEFQRISERADVLLKLVDKARAGS